MLRDQVRDKSNLIKKHVRQMIKNQDAWSVIRNTHGLIDRIKFFVLNVVSCTLSKGLLDVVK